MFATAKIFELLVTAGKKIGRVTGPWDRYFMVSRDVACSWGKRGLVMRSLMNHSEGKERVLVDGIRIAESDGWVLVRPDRKKAQFFVQAESESQSQAKEMMKKYVQLVKNWQK
jgi:phosphomannomutase